MISRFWIQVKKCLSFCLYFEVYLFAKWIIDNNLKEAAMAKTMQKPFLQGICRSRRNTLTIIAEQTLLPYLFSDTHPLIPSPPFACRLKWLCISFFIKRLLNNGLLFPNGNLSMDQRKLYVFWVIRKLVNKIVCNF